MISRIRRSIAAALALLLTVLTLGRVRVSWTGEPAAASDAGDPGRPAVTRSLGTEPPRPPT